VPSYQLLRERLEQAAAAKGDHTGYAIAKRTGLNQTTISRLRRGLVRPTAASLFVLARAYDIGVEELVDTSEMADGLQGNLAKNSDAAGSPVPTASNEHNTETAVQQIEGAR
jgi:transcriptional regulator with XRE-family HTH domain